MKVSGHCYCGSITFDVSMEDDDEPVFSVYCHCDSCRRAHSAPLYQVVCIERSMFSITSGESHIREFKKERGPVRAFCDECGSKVMNLFPDWRPGGKEVVVFFPSLLEPDTQHNLPAVFRPTKHVNRDESVLDPELFVDFFH